MLRNQPRVMRPRARKGTWPGSGDEGRVGQIGRLRGVGQETGSVEWSSGGRAVPWPCRAVPWPCRAAGICLQERLRRRRLPARYMRLQRGLLNVVTGCAFAAGDGELEALDSGAIAKRPRVRRLPVDRAVDLRPVPGARSAHNVVDRDALPSNWRRACGGRQHAVRKHTPSLGGESGAAVRHDPRLQQFGI
eukprot:scaffold49821_cov36-Phaeocystis_antarctica.AAC.1